MQIHIHSLDINCTHVIMCACEKLLYVKLQYLNCRLNYDLIKHFRAMFLLVSNARIAHFLKQLLMEIRHKHIPNSPSVVLILSESIQLYIKIQVKI